MSKGIYNRGYLPHWDFAKSVQAITFRLADSVPAAVIRSWKEDISRLPDESIRQKELHRRIARYEDAGHGSSILRHEDYGSIVQDQLIEGHAVFYKLIEWVIMPNHVHVLVRLLGENSLPSVVRRWKGSSSFCINRTLSRQGKLWSVDYFDRFIRDGNHLLDCIAYIRNNSVKAKLCDRPEDWPLSSAGMQWSADFSPPETPSDSQAD